MEMRCKSVICMACKCSQIKSLLCALNSRSNNVIVDAMDKGFMKTIVALNDLVSISKAPEILI